jgi:hypothetical protein
MSEVKHRVLAFDIGIKNLAFCVLETVDASHQKVLALENCSLLEPVATVSCSACPHKATYQSSVGLTCKRHAAKTHPLWPVEQGDTLPALKAALKEAGLPTKGTKAALLETAFSRWTFPYKAPKQASAASQTLTDLHDALRAFVARGWPTFSGCDAVLLENQPAFKNPHMKSVQVLLFAVLREAFLVAGQRPSFHLVHAKKKVADATAGDAGYKERKQGSEKRVHDAFAANPTNPFYEAWCAVTKKSDMADAYCMCVDFISPRLAGS